MRFTQRKAKKSKSGYTWTVRFDYINMYGQKDNYSKGGFATKKEARQHGLEMQEQLNRGIDIKQKKATINELFTDYMEVIGKNELARNTQYSYRELFKNHIESSIGNCFINDVRYRDIQLFFNELNFSKSTCSSIKGVLTNVFNYAIQNGYIDNNPLRDVKIHGTESEKVESITHEQFKQIIEYTLTPPKNRRKLTFSRKAYAISFYLGYYLGLRISETLALEKNDFDFQNNTVTIEKQLVHHNLKKKDYYVTYRMKTKSSKCVLPLPKPLKDVLVEWFKFNPNELVCCNENGNYLCVPSISVFDGRLSKHLGFKFNYHRLRHSYATNLVTSGVDVATTSKLLRHTNTTTTLDVYTDAKQDNMKKAVELTFSNNFKEKAHNFDTKTIKSAMS